METREQQSTHLDSSEVARWVNRARRGDRQAFGILVLHYQQRVRAAALSICGVSAAGSDIAQDAFLVAWVRLDQLRDPRRFGPWVCTIARNKARSWLRVHGRTCALNSEEAVADGAPSPREAAIRGDQEQLLGAALESLDERYREPLVLFYLEGESVKKVAAALGVTEATARQRLSRGRKQLGKRVDGLLRDRLRHPRLQLSLVAGVLAALSSRHAAAASGLAAGGWLQAGT